MLSRLAGGFSPGTPRISCLMCRLFACFLCHVQREEEARIKREEEERERAEMEQREREAAMRKENSRKRRVERDAAAKVRVILGPRDIVWTVHLYSSVCFVDWLAGGAFAG